MGDEARHFDHWAIYGNTRILRSWCPDCNRYSFVIRKKRQCCDGTYEPSETGRFRRMSEPYWQRKRPGAVRKKEILESQDWRCYWCNQRFGEWVTISGKPRMLKIEWDHVVPYVWSANNRDDNYVAACRPCNAWKGALMFNAEDEVRIYVKSKWDEEKAVVSAA